MRLSTAIISAAFVLVGCAAVTGPNTYPVEWASIKSVPTPDGCPGLAGTYSNQAVATFPAPLPTPLKLTDVFTRMVQARGGLPRAPKDAWPSIPDDVTSVSIEQTQEALAVTFASAQGDRATLQFRRYHFSWSEERYDDLFTCYLAEGEPRLRFLAEPESHSGASPIGFEGGGTLVMLLRAVDNALIVQWRSESLLFWVGLVGSGYKVDSAWLRFPSLDGSSPDRQ